MHVGRRWVQIDRCEVWCAGPRAASGNAHDLPSPRHARTYANGYQTLAGNCMLRRTTWSYSGDRVFATEPQNTGIRARSTGRFSTSLVNESKRGQGKAAQKEGHRQALSTPSGNLYPATIQLGYKNGSNRHDVR